MLKANHWERGLLEMAHAALDSDVSALAGPADTVALQAAYRHSENITRESSKTFFMASALLPRDKRRAARALYAFCRVSDDLVDRPSPENKSALLEAWRHQVIFGTSASGAYGATASAASAASAALPEGARQVSLAWADARLAYRVPRGYVDQLLDGLALDLDTVRYDTITDLSRYCYGVACTVGLMSMHVTGYSGREAIPYAIRLGVALQLTNILRDVGEDWRAGRLYLPLEELDAFGVSLEQIEAGVIDRRWRALMRYQIERAHRLYTEALPGIALLNPDGRFAIAAAGELYRGILERIEASDYNVFNHRASLSKIGKLRRLPGIWLRSVMAKT